VNRASLVSTLFLGSGRFPPSRAGSTHCLPALDEKSVAPPLLFQHVDDMFNHPVASVILITMPGGQPTKPKTNAPMRAKRRTLEAVSRVSSPASIRSWKSPDVPSSDIYAPARSVEPFISTARNRSMLNSSLVSSHSSLASDPYTPSRRTQNVSVASMSMLVHPTVRVPVHDAD
jgi:hypothetical protein